jgi:hypothetical protein
MSGLTHSRAQRHAAPLASLIQHYTLAHALASSVGPYVVRCSSSALHNRATRTRVVHASTQLQKQLCVWWECLHRCCSCAFGGIPTVGMFAWMLRLVLLLCAVHHRALALQIVCIHSSAASATRAGLSDLTLFFIMHAGAWLCMLLRMQEGLQERSSDGSFTAAADSEEAGRQRMHDALVAEARKRQSRLAEYPVIKQRRRLAGWLQRLGHSWDTTSAVLRAIDLL